MKWPENPRSIRRRRCGAPRARRSASVFIHAAGFAEADGGFAVTLDGKPIRTPSGRQVVAPTRAIAEAIAAEWNAQGETIDPLTMPLTRFANSVVEAVADRVDAVADDVAKYLGTDLLFYRAGHPEALVAREAAHWDPIAVLGGGTTRRPFHPGRGHRARRPAGARRCKAARGAFPADPWSVAALHVVTTLTGSALLALALAHGVRDADQVWAAAHVDEDWNIEKWGMDEEVAARRAARLVDFRAAVSILNALQADQRKLTGVYDAGVAFRLRAETSDMAISINPVLPVIAAQEAGATAPDLVLQPGSVVNAQVLKVLSADLVRIAIASLSIDVLSEIPLQEGQTLQLAVSQTQDGIRLAVVGQGGDAATPCGRRRYAVAWGAGRCRRQSADHHGAARNVLTPLERAAVSAAAQAAATEQESLAPLFANLGAAASSGNLPPKLQQAIAQVLAQQTSLDQNLGGGDIKTAFQKSGHFSRSVAGDGRRSRRSRRARSQGRADRAAPDAANGARHGRGTNAGAGGRCGSAAVAGRGKP